MRVLADTSNGDIGWKKWVVAGWAVMECLLFGGLMFGWGSVVFMLKNEGIYTDLCPQSLTYTDINVTTMDLLNDEVCKEQDSKMTLCFTIACALLCVGCAVLGHVNYKFGTRVTRIVSFSLFIMGSLMMAFVSKETPWLMFPGLSSLAIGGIAILMTNTQVSNLFLTGSSSLIGLLSGAFDSSSAVMLVFKIAVENGFSRKNMFFIITALHSLYLVSTFLFLPKDFITRPEVDKVNKHVSEDELLENSAENGHATKDTSPALLKYEKKGKPSSPTLLQCVKKPMFITHVIWLSLLQLRFYIFIGTLNQYLNRVLDNDKDLVSYFTNICFSIMIGGLVTSFLSGIMYDWQKNRCKDGKSERYRKVMPAVLPLTTSSILGIILSVLVLIHDKAVLYVAFITVTSYRSFFYSLAVAFLTTIFPIELFGMLYGIVLVCAGLFGLLQYGFFKWAESYADGPFHANILLLLLVVLSLLHPAYLWVSCWKEERKMKFNK